MKIGIIGAGPCGIMSAISIKRNNLEYEVTLFDKAKDIGSRIKISGNGRCNFYNNNLTEEKYSNILYARKLISYKEDLFEIIDESGLAYYYDEEGRYYPYSESSSSVIHAFQSLLMKYKITILCPFNCNEIKFINNKIKVSDGNTNFEFDRLVVAIGGISSNNDRLNYNIINKEIDAKFSKLTPSLCPISTSSFSPKMEGKRIRALVKLKYKNEIIKEEIGEILFKKNGLSGIVIFNISSYLARLHISNYNNYKISLDLCSNMTDDELNKYYQKDKSLCNLFIKEIAEEILSRGNNIINTIRNFEFDVKDLYDFKNSQVTSGGIMLSEINENCSLKKHTNVFVGGELLDIDGECGGYNIGLALLNGVYIGGHIK